MILMQNYIYIYLLFYINTRLNYTFGCDQFKQTSCLANEARNFDHDKGPSCFKKDGNDAMFECEK